MATSHAYVILTQPQRRRICQTRRTKEWISTTCTSCPATRELCT